VEKVLSGLRIINVSTSLPSGAGRAFMIYSRALRELGAEVEAWTFAPDQAMLAELAAEGFTTRVLGLLKHSYRLSSSKALAAALADSAPDWVHAHSYETVLHASRAKAMGAFKHLMICQHDARLRWPRRLYAWSHRTAPEMVIAHTPTHANTLATWYGYPPERVVALPLPVSDACFEAHVRQKALADELGVAGAYPVVTWVGRLQREKGHADLLWAFRTVVARFPAARLLLVGSGKHGDYLENLARRLGLREHVVFTGVRGDVPQILALTDVFACPSHAETLCMAVQEAMAAGKPVVSTDVSGPHDYIADGENGLIVPIGRPKPMAEAILRLAGEADLARRLGQAARAYAQEHFSTTQFVTGLGSIYVRAIGGRTP